MYVYNEFRVRNNTSWLRPIERQRATTITSGEEKEFRAQIYTFLERARQFPRQFLANQAQFRVLLPQFLQGQLLPVLRIVLAVFLAAVPFCQD